jgi:hypothetical protein
VVVPQEKPKPAIPFEPVKGTLELTIIKAILIRDTDSFTNMDPLCIVDFNGFNPPPA